MRVAQVVDVTEHRCSWRQVLWLREQGIENRHGDSPVDLADETGVAGPAPEGIRLIPQVVGDEPNTLGKRSGPLR